LFTTWLDVSHSFAELSNVSRGGEVFTSVCLCVLYVFLHNISKTDAAGVNKLDTEMFHDECWKPIYFWVIRVKVTSHKNVAEVGLCWLLLVNTYLLTPCMRVSVCVCMLQC